MKRPHRVERPDDIAGALRDPVAGSRDDVAFHAIPADSDTAFVAFSALSKHHAPFHFFLTLAPVEGVSKLLVRDTRHSWYNAGLPGVGESLDDIATAIRQELDELHARRVITIGSSMGGYAAILFGCLIGADRAIALGPQTLLDPVLPHSPPANVPLQAPDLRPIALNAPATRIEILAGWDSLTDVFHAQRLEDIPSVRALALPRMGHASAVTLKRDGALLSVLTDLREGRLPRQCRPAPEVPRDLRERIAETVFATARHEWSDAARNIGPVAERYPDWAAPAFALGEALAQLGDWRGVQTAAASAVAANPNWFEPHMLLGRALLEQQHVAEAADAYRQAIAVEPDWPNGHRALARCLTLLGRSNEAADSLRCAKYLDTNAK